jgi:DNA polymerase-4
MCGCICVELKDWNFHSHSHQAMLDAPTDSSTVLYENACKLLTEFWDLTPVRLIGLRTTKISDEEFAQLSLFDTARKQKLENMEKAIDAIRSKYGIDSVKRASLAVTADNLRSQTLFR